eukprot:scaffold9891_cov83-Phaeocystis_antarctica.AAC.3
MPRAPSPGTPRQGRRCAHARRGRPPTRAAGRPRANGRGPRSPRGPAADAAAAGGPVRTTRRRAGGSGALPRCLPRPPRYSRPPARRHEWHIAAACARSCRCTRTMTRRPSEASPLAAPRLASAPAAQAKKPSAQLLE